MPTEADIQRLEALVGGLLPLAAKRRGELIAARDWNTLVGSLIEVARAALTASVPGAVGPHEHPDQVAIGWLDPRVRALVTGGGVRDPGMETELLKIRRDLGTVSGRVDRADEEITRSRNRIDEVSTNDLTRQATLDRLNRKVLGAADDRGDIADLRGTLRILQTEVGRAVEVGSRLEHNGQPIDVAELVDRVASVETLRERLTQPSGALLDAGALEIRLQELQATLVTQEALTEAIDEVRRPLVGFDRDALLDQAREAARETATERVDVLRTELRSELDSRVAEIRPTVNAEVERATATLGNDLLGRAGARADAAVREGDDRLRADLSAQFEQRLGATADRVDERLSGLQDLVRSGISEQLDVRLDEVLAQARAGLDDLRASVAGLDEQTRSARASLDDLAVRVETVRREDAAAAARFRNEVSMRLTEVEGRIGPRVDAALNELRGVLRAELEASVTASRRNLETLLAKTAREAAATEVQLLSARVRGDVQGIVRQEVDSAFSGVREQVSGEIAVLQQRVQGLVVNEVSRVTVELPQLVSREFEAFRPEIVRLIGTQVSRPITPLRPIE